MGVDSGVLAMEVICTNTYAINDDEDAVVN
jgi:hypothetical protein